MLHKRHNVVLPKQDGGLEIYPMKQWLRDHSDVLPDGMDAHGNTSHELRRELCKLGWGIRMDDTQVLLIKPAEGGDISYADGLIEGESESGDEEALLDAEEVTFGLERDLQKALRANIHQLEKGLKIIDGDKERITEAGRIDITARDPEDNIVIIELKAGTATPEVIAQVLAYMGAVAESDKKPVRGVLIAGEFHKRVILAARAIPNLQLRRYSFQFSFESVK